MSRKREREEEEDEYIPEEEEEEEELIEEDEYIPEEIEETEEHVIIEEEPRRSKRKPKRKKMEESDEEKKPPKKKKSEEKRKAKFRSKPSKAVLERMERATTQKLYLLGNKGNDEKQEFQILGTKGDVYEVTISTMHSCMCFDATKNICKHMLFVLLKVLGLEKSDPLSYQKALLKDEAKQILSTIDERLKDDTHCLFCFDAFVEGDKVTSCEKCKMKYHIACLEDITDKLKEEEVSCVSCGAKNLGKEEKKEEIPMDELKKSETETKKEIQMEEKKEIPIEEIKETTVKVVTGETKVEELPKKEEIGKEEKKEESGKIQTTPLETTQQ